MCTCHIFSQGLVHTLILVYVHLWHVCVHVCRVGMPITRNCRGVLLTHLLKIGNASLSMLKVSTCFPPTPLGIQLAGPVEHSHVQGQDQKDHRAVFPAQLDRVPVEPAQLLRAVGGRALHRRDVSPHRWVSGQKVRKDAEAGFEMFLKERLWDGQRRLKNWLPLPVLKTF